MDKTKSGFTLVELLIVIVVIAILAAITIVAYNGIQSNARNSQTTSAVASYIQALQMYKIDNGQYPPVTACLGDKYNTTGCDSAGTYTVNGGGLNTTYLSQYIGSTVPMPAANSGLFSTGRQIGGAIYAWNNGTYGGANNGGIGLYQQGSSNCPVIGNLTLKSSDRYLDNSGAWCRYSMN